MFNRCTSLDLPRAQDQKGRTHITRNRAFRGRQTDEEAE
ncbi:hypothetical protein TM5383_03211 [Thalassovita mediterranea]|uniref:Uncharacterized protein n=1 Tax=Thalassovita mediterranea TaxID=340021 RepID=A0A0P1HGF7_9RHOB|nr:hypothetical protein TM5383_03211 [Thalassovita mediterranea]SIS32952.1 hypothetical protein SAMN05421685_107162 [Thalassovita mediterranea]